MVGFKHIHQTITGEKADEILKKLPQKDSRHQKKSPVPLPDKFTVSSKK